MKGKATYHYPNGAIGGWFYWDSRHKPQTLVDNLNNGTYKIPDEYDAVQFTRRRKNYTAIRVDGKWELYDIKAVVK
jgi:hypothetical protein